MTNNAEEIAARLVDASLLFVVDEANGIASCFQLMVCDESASETNGLFNAT